MFCVSTLKVSSSNEIKASELIINTVELGAADQCLGQLDDGTFCTARKVIASSSGNTKAETYSDSKKCKDTGSCGCFCNIFILYRPFIKQSRHRYGALQLI